MDKYYLKANGKEVKVGDIIKVCKKIETEFGYGAFTIHVELTKDLIPKLIEKGILEAREDIQLDIKYFINKFAKRYGIEEKVAISLIDKMIVNDPSNALRLLLKEVSLYFNSEEELKTLSQVYTISSLDGKVCPICLDNVKSNMIPFAAFASRKKAKKAKGILYPIFLELYGEQEDKEC